MESSGSRLIIFTTLGPGDEVYTVRANDSGVSFVRFGDGQTGSRLPSGVNNLKAKFRTGLGAGGNLPPGRLNNLMTRPLGLQGVHQPCPSSGGEDPEQGEDARENAPLAVKALGRLVSLSDYTDFARAYAGIAKAHAVGKVRARAGRSAHHRRGRGVLPFQPTPIWGRTLPGRCNRSAIPRYWFKSSTTCLAPWRFPSRCIATNASTKRR